MKQQSSDGRFEWGYAVEKRGETPSLAKQVHGATCLGIADHASRERLLREPPDADGVFTAAANLALYVFTADCLPVLLSSDSGKLAALHSGWRGALEGIVSNPLRQHFAGDNVRAILGPCILACCFEVKEDFIRTFEARDKPIRRYLESRNGKTYCHLDRYVEDVELKANGVKAIDRTLLRCTYCSIPTLPSYRRLGNTDLRLRTWIQKI